MQSASPVKKHCKLPLPEFIILVVWFSILLAFNEFRIFARALPHPYVYGFEKFGLVMLISTLAFNLRYSDLTPSVRLLTRGLVSLFLFYGILYFSPEYPELVNDLNQKIYTDLFLGRILAISLAIVGFFRPSFALLIFVYPVWQKNALGNLTGIPISHTDFETVAQLGQYLIFSVCGFHIISRTATKLNYKFSKEVTTGFCEWLLWTSIAFHFSNYYYSALKKVLISGSPLTWISENPSEILFINSIWTNQFFNFLSPTVVNTVYYLIHSCSFALNFFVFIIQIVTLIAVLRRAFTIALLGLLDCMHIGIFLASAIFFWKWFVLNLVFIWAIKRELPGFGRSKIKWFLPAVVVMGPRFFSVVELGWLDTPAMNVLEMKAVTASGGEYTVPSNYFLAMSLPFAQIDYVPAHKGQITTGTYGATVDYETFIKAKKCNVTYVDTKDTLQAAVEKTSLRSFITAHHRFILKNADERGRYNYNFFPHHIWSNLTNDPFYALDKKDIVGYRIVSHSICTDLETLSQKSLRNRTSYEIPVR